MAIKHVVLIKGQLQTIPKNITLKPGDEVHFTLSDSDYSSMFLSFPAPAPFANATLLVKEGEKITLPVRPDFPPGSLRIVVEQLMSKKPPDNPKGTVSGDIDVTPD